MDLEFQTSQVIRLSEMIKNMVPFSDYEIVVAELDKKVVELETIRKELPNMVPRSQLDEAQFQLFRTLQELQGIQQKPQKKTSDPGCRAAEDDFMVKAVRLENEELQLELFLAKMLISDMSVVVRGQVLGSENGNPTSEEIGSEILLGNDAKVESYSNLTIKHAFNHKRSWIQWFICGMANTILALFVASAFHSCYHRAVRE